MSTNPAAAHDTHSTIGLKNVVIAPLTTDTETGHTYGDLQLLAGAIEANVTPNNTDPDIQYADDIEFDTLYSDPDIDFALTMADIPLAIQEMIMNNHIDNNGVLIKSASDKPGYFAVGFKSEKSNGKYRYVWLYKVRATPISDTFATKEGDTVNRQTPQVQFHAIKRTHDGRYQAVADEGENGFTAAAGETFLASVYEPTFTNAGG